MTDQLMMALAQPEPRREEQEEALAALMVHPAAPEGGKARKKSGESPADGFRQAPRFPETRQERPAGAGLAVWDGALLQKAAERREEGAELRRFPSGGRGEDPAGTPIFRERRSEEGPDGVREAAEAVSPALALLTRLRRGGQGADFARQERRRLSLTLPEPEPAAGGPALDAEALDRAVERDARRYDRGFTLF